MQPPLSGVQELQKVQQQLRKMLFISRNIILERELLLALKINLDEPDPFLVTQDIPNRSSLIL